MKIAFMSSGTIKSSISYRPLSLAKELVKKGHEVYIFAPKFDKYSKFKDEGIEELSGVKIMRPWQLKFFPFELGLLPYITSSAVMLYKLRPDIVHIFKPNPITLTGLLPKFTQNIPVVLDKDDLDTEVMKIENNPKLKIKLVELSEKVSTPNASAITAASKFLRKLYYSRYKNKTVSHIPNGADFANAHDMKVTKLSENRIVFVGSLNRITILEPLFYALEKLKQQKIKIHAVIIGDGEYLDYFKKLSKKLGVNKYVTFKGWIPQNRLNEHIKVGDVGYCYMPNELTIKACSSMKVFQYMQFGAVPLVSNVGDLPMYVFNGKAGYIAKHEDNQNLLETIIKALKDKKGRMQRIKYSQTHGAKKFNWETLSSEVEKVYKEVIN